MARGGSGDDYQRGKVLWKKPEGAATKGIRNILESAKLKQSYTTVRAPSDGYVTRKSAEVGNQVQSDQPLMAVVPLKDIWVIANYKETQLDLPRLL